MIVCTAIAAALLAASPGATVATGPVVCPARLSLAKMALPGVTLDATGAAFPEGVAVTSVAGLHIQGGTYGTRGADTVARYAVAASAVTDFSLSNATVLAGPGGDRGGVQIRASSRVTVRDNLFIGHRTGLSLYEVTDFLAARNRFREATSDGINSVGNQRGIISANDCHWTVRVGNAHPDCIQLWSIPLKPLQADIWVVNNRATGMMQGILSSDPKTGSGTRLHFHGNYMAVVFSHTITCGACTDSVATDNVLASYPGSLFGIGKMKGAFVLAERNVMRDGVAALPARVWWLGVPDLHGRVGSAFDRRAFNPVAVEAAP